MKKHPNGFTFWDTVLSFTLYMTLILVTLPIFRILLLEYRELEIEQHFIYQLQEHLYDHLSTSLPVEEDPIDHKILYHQTEGEMSFFEEDIFIRGEIRWVSYRNIRKEIVFYGIPY
ncbi:hypothetical protein RZN22_01165 [Bacillaceae bacterium S4-13-58]